MNDEQGQIYLGQCCNRAIATILTFKDCEVDEYLPPGVAAKLRRIIMDELNEFAEEAIDLISENSGLNQYYLDMITQIHNVVVPDAKS